MTHDELRQLEGARRRTLWALACLRPGDPTASDLLAILDDLDDQERNDTPLAISHSTSFRFVTLSR